MNVIGISFSIACFLYGWSPVITNTGREFQIIRHNINNVELCVSNYGKFGQDETGWLLFRLFPGHLLVLCRLFCFLLAGWLFAATGQQYHGEKKRDESACESMSHLISLWG